MGLPYCPETLATGSQGEPLCLDANQAPVAWEAYESVWTPDLLDPSALSAAFALGFAIYVGGWAIGKVPAVFLSFIRRH